MNSPPGAELFLSRFADGEWREVVRPWLEAGRGSLERALVVVPNRGRAQALKQRCLSEGVALLGVEFLTPGLARRKLGPLPALPRSLQLLVLRDRIEARLSATGPEDPARGIWRSLESDLEAALDDFEDLARAGHAAGAFPRAELAAVFTEMEAWAEAHGYALAPVQDRDGALSAPARGSPAVADRLLVLAGGAEGWSDFLGLVALIRRCATVSVVLAVPEFNRKDESGERWVLEWERVLGVEATALVEDDPEDSCAGVAELWSDGQGSAERAGIIVASSRADEMSLVAGEIARLLAAGSENIAVVFTGAGAAHSRLVGLLEAGAIAYADLIGAAGTPPEDVRIQRAMADFYERGCRIEELLALWPLLRAQNLAKLSLGRARRACGELFDEVQSHGLEAGVAVLESSGKEGATEVGRVARILLPGWPDRLAPGAALALFDAARDRLGLPAPAGWSGLVEFAGRVAEPMPARAILEAIRSYLPDKGPMESSAKATFARVTLTTCRRAAGVAWSDCIFAEANSDAWPDRREPSCWLGEDARRLLAAEGPFKAGLPTSEERAAAERRLYCSIARDTRGRVIFSASLSDEENPEARLSPNVWLERVMWARGLLPDVNGETAAFEALAVGAPETPMGETAPGAGSWQGVWEGRRDPARPFDEYFLGDPGGRFRPERLSASQVQAAVADPATLWFGAVLGVRRVDWRPFARARGKAMGTMVHGVLKSALAGAPAEGSFASMPDRVEAALRLEEGLARLRRRWPEDRYWESFVIDASRAARELLAKVYDLPASAYSAVEAHLPPGATVPAGEAGRIEVHGRMDLVLSDRPRWDGARVEIADFKTGGDKPLSAARMASSGASLQLGVDLAAAESLGATGGVSMLKPEESTSRIATEEIAVACARLPDVGRHLLTGIYGALTRDRTEYSRGFEWPLACAPIAESILLAKFAATFGGAPAEEEEPGDE